jgi:Protein of unknown function (DUF2971)
MGSAEVVPPPPKGTRRVYHFTKAEFAKDDIINQRLKIARISELNDPFEFLALNFRAMSDRHVIDYFKNNYDKHTGLLCFSQNWTSPVLWTHYANKHSGICLGFNVKEDLLRKVDYIEKRAIIPLAPNTTAQQVLVDLEKFVLSTKYDHWSYEEEFRYFVPLKNAIEDKEGKLHFLPFNDDIELAEVILGPFCDMSFPDAQQLVKAHCRPDQVTTFPTRLAVQWFAVVPDDHRVPTWAGKLTSQVGAGGLAEGS